jgi:GTP-binding protein Era
MADRNMSEQKNEFRCGYVAIVGRPNVGKSTLLNRILGQKISITTRKPQTTRHRINGIKTTADAQVVYVDTPGVHRDVKKQLNRVMNRAAVTALSDVDVIVFVVEGLSWKDEDQYIFQHISKTTVPLVIAINKTDKLKDKDALLPFIKLLKEKTDCDQILPISAHKGENVEALEKLVTGMLPVGTPIYEEDQVTDRSMRFLAAEIIREKLMRRLAQELPYATAVEIEKFDETARRFEINALIWVERPGQKAIVIGKQGATLKEIGKQARLEMQKVFDHKVHLEIWVKVKESWSEDVRMLRNLGLDEHG